MKKKVYILVFLLFAVNYHYAQKHSVTIEASKKIYKMYEPVHLLYKIINASDQIDTLCQEFGDHNDYVRYEVTDISRGKVYDSLIMPEIGLVVSYPQYFLPPKDTLLISMVLNTKFGENLSVRGSHLFNSYCYFLPGKYKVFAKIYFCKSKNKYITIEKNKYITNETEFEIAEPSEEDKEIVELVRTKKFSEAINKYSSNPLMEAVIRDELTDYYPHFEKNYPPTREEILLKYDGFLSRFPNSYYCYNIYLIFELLRKLAYANSDVIEDIGYLEEKYSGSALIKFFNQPVIKNTLIKDITRLRNNLHE